jgi:Ran GTPase-activating protein (RanGAP) involved in mRNA processing and transport
LISDTGASKLADFLDFNGNTLKVLVLHWNKIGSQGGLRIAQALKRNDHLKILDLSWNQIGKVTQKSIGLMPVSQIRKLAGGGPQDNFGDAINKVSGDEINQ